MLTAPRSSPLVIMLILMVVVTSLLAEAISATDLRPGSDAPCAQGDECCAPAVPNASDAPAGEDCCPNGCDGCFLPCCTGIVFTLTSPVTLARSDGHLGTFPSYRSDVALADPREIYHPPRP